MKQAILTSNAQALTTTLIERGMTAKAAATAARINANTFGKLIRRDEKISLKTASKLKATFGDAAIKFNAEPLSVAS